MGYDNLRCREPFGLIWQTSCHLTFLLLTRYTHTHIHTQTCLSTMSGCCDGNPEDDLKLPNGTVVREVGDMMIFLQAWRVHTTDETEHTRRVGDNCTTGDCSTCLSMLYQRAFTPCHSKVPSSAFKTLIVVNVLSYFVICLLH